jgi:hypothetical protein
MFDMTEHDGVFPFSLTEDCTQALNPYLYKRLRARFTSVQIAKQGEPSRGEQIPHDRSVRYRFVHSGEYYRVCCPFCSQKQAVDTRHRLWIHHRWGVGLDKDDPLNRGDKFWWACICYNEGCMERQDNVKELRNWIYSGVGRERHAPAIEILKASDDAVTLGIVDWPGQCLRVDQLPREHQAFQYLLSRGFDPMWLGPKYDVSFCVEMDPQYPVAHQKLIIPIRMRGQMVSWQARPPYDIDFSAAGQPKYYNCPGTNKRLMLYGYDEAKDLPFAVVVEGVTDVWAHGPGTVSILGKSMAHIQANTIASTWKAAILVLDPEASEEAMRMKEQLNRIPVVLVQLPTGLDPATTDHEYFWDTVLTASIQQGVDLLGL